MTNSPTDLPDIEATHIAEWLQAHHLSLPAWILLESVRPFGWLLGQSCLLVQPLARGMGWEQPIAIAIRCLDNPELLATLSEAIAPERKGS